MRWFKRLFFILGALLFLQIPTLMDQYEHQLIGRLTELVWQVEQMGEAASRSHLSLNEYTTHFVANEDKVIATQGRLMQKIQRRHEKTVKALHALQTSSVWQKPFIWLIHLQPDTLLSTLKAFKMNIGMSVESCLYALIGGTAFLLILPTKKKR